MNPAEVYSPEQRRAAARRFWPKVEWQLNDCLLYVAKSCYTNGYGKFEIVPKKGMGAHRAAMIILTGSVPQVVDHLCHNRDENCPGGHNCLHRRCVRLDHLADGSTQDNLLGSRLTLAGQNALKTRCPVGHEYDGINSKGDRICKRCAHAASIRYRQKKAI